ncbi:MAG: FAD-binding oxidoreductase [Hormoscilla sp. GUM202]|nr:FAD-binding oxidoreductase [Hormoscilla sp. GUM202]
MKTYDWIVVGAGITGAALGYELVKKGFSVLLIEQQATPENATRYSYGTLAYWSGTSDITRQLCLEGKERHQILSAELDADTEFRELDLLLTIDRDDNPQAVLAEYEHCAIKPQLLSTAEACSWEPLLNPDAISGALTTKTGHINPQATAKGYWEAMRRNGGAMEIAKVRDLLRDGSRITGVITDRGSYYGANTVICAGGFSRRMLKVAGILVRLYFTHAELIEIAPVPIQLRTIVMPNLQRYGLEAKACELDSLWDYPGHEPVPPILDPGAVQFLDGSIRLGQMSRVLTDPEAKVDSSASEAAIRTHVGKILPALGQLPGTWHSCLVAFSGDIMPVVGPIPGMTGIHVFSSFTYPMVFVPPIAQRFANHMAGGVPDDFIPQMSPTRFGLS